MRGGWRADLMAAMISTVLEGTAGTLLRMAEARSDQDLMSEIARYLAQFGFSAFVLTRLSRSQGADPDILLDGWPQGWADRYAEAGHYKYDPVAKHCMDASDVFSWDEIPPPLLDDVRARSIPHEAAEFALKDGVCVPMPAALGVGGMSLAGDRIEYAPGLKGAVRLLASFAFQTFETLPVKSRKSPLTAREIDVLHWIAAGKTVRNIGEILVISDHTVGEHLKNVRRKLGTTNGAHSVVRALQLGLLHL